MSTRAILTSCAIMLVGAYMVGTEVPLGAPREDVAVAAPSASLPTATQALSGMWEGAGQGKMKVRLVVQRVHAEWASVLFTWRSEARDDVPSGWIRTRAKLLPDGALHLSYPVHLTFKLSEDWAHLVGTSRLDPVPSLLLSRTASDKLSAYLMPLPEDR